MGRTGARAARALSVALLLIAGGGPGQAEGEGAGAPEAVATTPQSMPRGTVYPAGRFDAWEMLCTRSDHDADPCELYQTLRDEGGAPVAEINLINLEEADLAAAATVLTPLGTYLPGQVGLVVDGTQLGAFPFVYCASIGCVAQLSLSRADIEALRRGRMGASVIYAADDPARALRLSMPRDGFIGGFAAILRANAAADAAAAAAAGGSAPGGGGN
ncbi:MAG: invasion associated locus B family protein [Gemmobacter sp.]